ncbi:PIR protein [Plasmodium yoelii]|uniref:PIR protein n=3 Tax=Plasmodium yoelii TaxID=5861 RepID=A0AAE9WS22_PLAYO|nr:PIR protein [Plasmodium yoelii]XP_022813801.1 PIR protein [Plasmodium yoelii]WBY58942.1 PIR protein [Plasmodium yoelii yoelii]WBY58945.1 PIR protein [Plasmodium yoelii yoelii]VTZ79774.1 PIR protein [Plasmodium yoelii]VTZ79777.1 PIR protein [Plasmodium yoelii]|eukprot:XP_022810752.1 PIR protein [Plasmodium yoelii]
MSSNVCDVINVIDNYLYNGSNTPGKYNFNAMFKANCPNQNSDSNEQILSCAFITLLTLFKNIVDKEHLKNDKLAEYAILWLSHKLNQKIHKNININNLNDFFVQYINENDKYNEDINDAGDYKSYKELINKKNDFMNMDIKDMSNFYDAFKSLCNMYSELNEKNSQCKKCLENAGEFFEKFGKLNNVYGITEGTSYSQLLSSLSNDYAIFESKYSSVRCRNVLSLIACPRSSVTKNTLITITIIFVAASILLGVSYKYSLFGFRKRAQKQYLREKIKNIKKKMNN